MASPRLWNYCKIIIGILVVLIFTPLVTPADQIEPTLLLMPYSLWVGILVSIILVLVTYLGSRVHPGLNTDQKTDEVDG